MKPNVIYILADDMGIGDVACLDQRCAWPTPHLDRLAARGMRFEDAHSSSAVCTPSRYSILTGRYAWRSWLKQGVTNGASAGLLRPGMPTVATMLRDAGYRTNCIGKWHMGWEWAQKAGECQLSLADRRRGRYDGVNQQWIDYAAPIRGGPLAHGFDEFFGIAASLDMPPFVYVDGDQPQGPVDAWGTAKDFFRAGPRQRDLQPHQVLGELTRRSCASISRQHSEQPFFLYLGLTAPHTPIAPAPEFLGASGVSTYGDFCMEVDHRVGQIMQAVADAGLDENTLIIFTSDNGCSGHQAECALLEQHFGHFSSAHYRGYKSDIWDGGHRVPFLVRWPEAVAAGSVCDEPMGIFDLYATLAAIIGHDLCPEEAVDSCSFLPALQGQPFTRAAELVHHSIDGRFALRAGPWKLCRCPGSGGWTLPDRVAEEAGLPPVQLYDFHDDRGEKINRSTEQPALVNDLTQRLHRLVCSGSSRPDAVSTNDPDISLEDWWQIDWRAELPAAMVEDD